MKAPENVYVRLENIGNSWDVSTLDNGGKEYISKDALMNYFHKRVEELNSPLNGVFGSTEREHCNERISELLLLIDKLNSM